MAYIVSYPKSETPAPTYENYIYNVGYCAFNTGYTHTSNTKIVFKAIIESWKSGGDWQNAFGALKGSYRDNSFVFWSRGDNTKFAFSRTGNFVQGDLVDAPETSTSANWPFTPCIFTAEGQVLSWYRESDPSIVRSLTSAGTVNGGVAPLAIFNINTATSDNGWSPSAGGTGFMKLFWFEIYESDVLLHRFVPAYNNSQYCLYDEVGETYIYDTINNGSTMRGYIAGVQIVPTLLMSMSNPPASEEEPESSEEVIPEEPTEGET